MAIFFVDYRRVQLTRRWTADSFSHFRHINYNCFYAVAFTLHLRNESGHFVAVERIADASVHV